MAVLTNNFDQILYLKKFTDDLSFSENLLSSYLKGVKIFGSDIVYGNGIIRKINFKDNFVLISSLQGNYICYFYKGISFYSSVRLIKFCNAIIKNNQQNPWLDEQNQIVMKQFEDQIEKYFGKYNYLLQTH